MGARIGPEVGYLAERGGELVGRYLTLRGALEATHTAFVRSHAPGYTGDAEFTSHTERGAEVQVLDFRQVTTR